MQAFGEISTKTRCGRKGLCNVLWAGARRVNQGVHRYTLLNVLDFFFSQQNYTTEIPPLNIHEEDENEGEPPIAEKSLLEKGLHALGGGIAVGVLGWLFKKKF